MTTDIGRNMFTAFGIAIVMAITAVHFAFGIGWLEAISIILEAILQ